MAKKRVGVFWDYENCRPPSTIPGFAVVDRLRQLVQHHGNITVFKAYMEFTTDNVNPRSTALQSELQSSGVSMTNCPHNGRKDVADKMILVDMLAFAIDNPDSSTAAVVLISGDRDFAYAVSVLRHRGYDVVVVVPVSCHSSLRAQASRVVEWRELFAPVVVTNAPKEGKDTNKSTDEGAASGLLSTQVQDRVPLKDRIAWLGDGDVSTPPPHATQSPNTPRTPTHRRNQSNTSAPSSSQRNFKTPRSRQRRTGTQDNVRDVSHQQRLTSLKWDEATEVEVAAAADDTFGAMPSTSGPHTRTSRRAEESTPVSQSPTPAPARGRPQSPVQAFSLFAGAIRFCAPSDDEDVSEAESEIEDYDGDDADNEETQNYAEMCSGDSRTPSVSAAISVSDDSPPESDVPSLVVLKDTDDLWMPAQDVQLLTTEDEGGLGNLEATEQIQRLTLEQRLDLTTPTPALNGPQRGFVQLLDDRLETCTGHQHHTALPYENVDRYDVILSRSVGYREEPRVCRYSGPAAYTHEDDEFVPDYGDESGSIEVEQPMVDEHSQRMYEYAADVPQYNEDDGEGEADMIESVETSSQVDHEEPAQMLSGNLLRADRDAHGSTEPEPEPKSTPFKLPLSSRISQASTSTLKPWANPFSPYVSGRRDDLNRGEVLHSSINRTTFSAPLKPSAVPFTSSREYSSPVSLIIPTSASLVRFSTLISILRSHQASTGDDFMKSALLGATLTRRDPNVYVREAAFEIVYETPEDSIPQQGSNLQARLSSNRPLSAPIKLKEYIKRAQRAGIVVLDRSEGWSSSGSVAVGLAPGVAKIYEDMYGKRKSDVSEIHEHDRQMGMDSELGSNTAAVALLLGYDTDTQDRAIGVVAPGPLNDIQSLNRDMVKNTSASPSNHTTAGYAGNYQNLTNARVLSWVESRPVPAPRSPLAPMPHQYQVHQGQPIAPHRTDQQDTAALIGSSFTISPSTGSLTTTNTTSQLTNTSSTSNINLNPSRPVPTFTPLISVLLQVHKPSHRIARKPLSNLLLKQFPDVYEREGIDGDKKFRVYIDSAERAGVVRTGGEGKHAWVELVERWTATR